MQKFIIVFFIVGIIGLISISANAAEWYEGGTLQKATVAEFMKADYDNALATTAAFVSVAISKKNLDRLDMEEFRHGVDTTLACIVTASAKVPAVQNQRAAAVAFICMQQLKKNFPWMLTKH